MAAEAKASTIERPHADEETVEEQQKSTKLGEEDACQNQQKATEKKPRLSTESFGDDYEISYYQLQKFLVYLRQGEGVNVAHSRLCPVTSAVTVHIHEVNQLHFYMFYSQFENLCNIFRHSPPIAPGFGLLAIKEDDPKAPSFQLIRLDATPVLQDPPQAWMQA